MGAAKFVDRLQVARRVLAEVKRQMPSVDFEIDVMAYSNGREQGIALRAFPGTLSRVAVFSEDRNSDDIVFYYGSIVEFSDSFVPNEAVYGRARYARCGHTKRIAAAVVRFISTGEVRSV